MTENGNLNLDADCSTCGPKVSVVNGVRQVEAPQDWLVDKLGTPAQQLTEAMAAAEMLGVFKNDGPQPAAERSVALPPFDTPAVSFPQPAREHPRTNRARSMDTDTQPVRRPPLPGRNFTMAETEAAEVLGLKPSRASNNFTLYQTDAAEVLPGGTIDLIQRLGHLVVSLSQTESRILLSDALGYPVQFPGRFSPWQANIRDNARQWWDDEDDEWLDNKKKVENPFSDFRKASAEKAKRQFERVKEKFPEEYERLREKSRECIVKADEKFKACVLQAWESAGRAAFFGGLITGILGLVGSKSVTGAVAAAVAGALLFGALDLADGLLACGRELDEALTACADAEEEAYEALVRRSR